MPAADLVQAAAARAGDDDATVAAIVSRETRRLRAFIRRRVADACDADDIAQDVFFELVEATRLATPIEHVGAWLFRVAANRITDRFRKKATLPLGAAPATAGDAGDTSTDALLASASPGPEQLADSRRLGAALEAALAELPEAQRSVFIAHELDGQSFKSLAAESGVGINTLLARKRYAVLHLRRRLQTFHDEL